MKFELRQRGPALTVLRLSRLAPVANVALSRWWRSATSPTSVGPTGSSSSTSAMDTTFKEPELMGRAVTDPAP
ncbi:MAG: hypothetical protein U1E17_15935 [Geminicoccaceae bacterium]